MNSVKEPLVSIIIPCYNSEKYINRTIISLKDQTYKNLQIVCINDGSTDKTQFLIDQLIKNDSRIELLNKENGGIESALKYGLTHLKGEYTFLIGHDDTLSEDAIEEALKAFNNNQVLDAVRSDLYVIFEDSTKNYIKNDRRVLSGKDAFLETIGGWNIHTFCLWRTSIFIKIKEIDAKGVFNFDELATRYLYLNCRQVGYCNGVYNYFQHEQSVTRVINVRRFQALYTDILIRQLLIEADLYKAVSTRFEQYALGNLIRLETLFLSMKSLSNSDKIYATNLIKEAFSAVNKKDVLSSFSSLKKRYWLLILSSFTNFVSYLKIRYLYYKLLNPVNKA